METTANTQQDEKARESRVRRQLKSQGFVLKKSRVQNINLDDQGGYQIIQAEHNIIQLGNRFDLTLENVEEFANA